MIPPKKSRQKPAGFNVVFALTAHARCVCKKTNVNSVFGAEKVFPPKKEKFLFVSAHNTSLNFQLVTVDHYPKVLRNKTVDAVPLLLLLLLFCVFIFICFSLT
jgi:hypothetical protein